MSNHFRDYLPELEVFFSFKGSKEWQQKVENFRLKARVKDKNGIS